MEGSFTQKRGVAIQPIEVIAREGMSLEAASRRSLFQRRRGGSSPISPQQLEAINKEGVESLSPTFRRCCMDCPSGDVVLFGATSERERKLSRGDTSDSSSKDGSIQSDTSIDSEDSCVSVIFVPHPEKFAPEEGGTAPGTPMALADMLKKQRSTSNSSESSDPSTGSGRGSPMSPAGNRIGSPVKCINGKSIKGPPAIAKIELFRQSGLQLEPQTIVTRNLSDNGNNASGGEMIFYIERPLEKIEERHTESESETEQDSVKENVPKPEESQARA